MSPLSAVVCVRKRIARVTVLLGVAMCLAGCGALLGPRSIEVPQSRLEQLIASRFPYRTTALGVLDVTVATPRLRLLVDTNRIASDLEIVVGERLFGNTYRGSITLSHGLRFEPSDSTVRLTNVSVDRFVLDGVPASWQEQLQRVGLVLSDQSLKELIVYTLRPQDVETMRSYHRHPGEVRVTPAGLLIMLVPE